MANKYLIYNLLYKLFFALISAYDHNIKSINTQSTNIVVIHNNH